MSAQRSIKQCRLQVCSCERVLFQAELLALVMAQGVLAERVSLQAHPWMVRCVHSHCFDKIPGKSHLWRFCGSRFEGTTHQAGEKVRQQQELGGSCSHPSLGKEREDCSLSAPFSVLTRDRDGAVPIQAGSSHPS